MRRVVTAEKLDLYRLHKDEYVTPKKPVLVDIGPAQYLSINGRGEPGGKLFQDQVGLLYGVAFTIKMTKKFAGRDYKVCYLEGLWWTDDGVTFVEKPVSVWNWKLLIRVPDFVTAEDLGAALAQIRKQGKPVDAGEVELETINEGRCVQVLHIGPYESERETISRMMELAREKGLSFDGAHHEIYLSDPRRVPAARLRTILRHPAR
jgi:hypothetical protein